MVADGYIVPVVGEALVLCRVEDMLLEEAHAVTGTASVRVEGSSDGSNAC